MPTMTRLKKGLEWLILNYRLLAHGLQHNVNDKYSDMDIVANSSDAQHSIVN